MSIGNPVLKKTMVSMSRNVKNKSEDQMISDLESQIKPFKRMELPDATNGARILQASNIVIPNA